MNQRNSVLLMGERTSFAAAWSGCLGQWSRRPRGSELRVAALKEGMLPFYMPRRPSRSMNTKQIERQRMHSEIAAKRNKSLAETRARYTLRHLDPPQQRSSEEVDKYARDAALFQELVDRVAVLREERRQKVGCERCLLTALITISLACPLC